MFVTVIIGFAAVCAEAKGLIILFVIFLLLSFLFTLGVAIFVFIGTQTRYWNEYTGCDAKYDGFLEAWNTVDLYLHSVDELFCSEKCPCYFNKTTAYKFITNTESAPYYGQWITSVSSAAPLKFQECEDEPIAEAYNNYLIRNAYSKKTFKPKKFHKFYKKVEEFFQCTGFCATTYYNAQTGTNMKMVKYLFSDVSKGVPKHIGCLEQIMDWLWKTLHAFAAICLALFLIQFLLFVILILFLVTLIREEKKAEAERRRAQKFKERQIQDETEKQNLKPSEEDVVPPHDISHDTNTIELGSFRPNDSQRSEKTFDFMPSGFKQ